MKSSRKLQKLFSSIALVSAWEHGRRLLHPVDSRRIFVSLDTLDFSGVRARDGYRPNPRRIRKFIEIVQDLWLDRSPPLQILDLGCGSGYFIYICRLFGHDGMGLDTDVEPLYRETLPILNVPRVVSRIEAQVPLPDLDRKFDLVVATRVCFHFKGWPQHLPGDEWREADWKFFVNDIRTRFLNPNGRLFLQFNPRRDDSPFFTPALRDCFLNLGGRIVRSKALFAANPAEVPQFKQKTSRNSSRGC
jgi:Methyltransferase domain.